MGSIFVSRVAACLCCPLLLSAATGEERQPSDEDFIGGPTSVSSELQSYPRPVGEEDTHPWHGFKGKVREQLGLDFSFDYTTLYQSAGTSLNGNDEGFSGVFRLYGKWELIGRDTANKGSLVAKVENRQLLGSDVVPNALGGNLGYLGTTGASFNNAGWFLAPLYWEQFFADGQAAFVAGRLDSLDFVDISGYSGQWLRFQNGSLLVNSTIPYPDLGMGGGGGFKVGDDWWVGASIHDANGAASEFEFLVDEAEFFKQAFVSWSPDRAQRMDRAAHFTAWHSDERTGLGVDEGWGLAVSGNWLFDNGVMPFVRAGWAEGSAARADAAVTAGMLYRFSNGLGELGGAVGWESLSGSGLGNQKAAELFFRWDVTPSFALTPSIQVLIDPALNSSDDTIVLGGVRARINF